MRAPLVHDRAAALARPAVAAERHHVVAADHQLLGLAAPVLPGAQPLAQPLVAEVRVVIDARQARELVGPAPLHVVRVDLPLGSPVAAAPLVVDAPDRLDRVLSHRGPSCAAPRAPRASSRAPRAPSRASTAGGLRELDLRRTATTCTLLPQGSPEVAARAQARSRAPASRSRRRGVVEVVDHEAEVALAVRGRLAGLRDREELVAHVEERHAARTRPRSSKSKTRP